MIMKKKSYITMINENKKNLVDLSLWPPTKTHIQYIWADINVYQMMTDRWIY